MPYRIVCLLFFTFWSDPANAQLVDGLLGQKRTVVQVLLRPYRIMDYERDRVVYNIEKGVHQTILYENDTCKNFYWAVGKEYLTAFNNKLVASGYSVKADDSYVKDSLELTVRPLTSGKATLFMARLSENLSRDRDVSGRVSKKKKGTRKKKVFDFEALPLLQQAILAEENDTIKKKPKNPERHWVGEKEGKTSILGWEK